jgi:IclR family mhp operon transcriptional activator
MTSQPFIPSADPVRPIRALLRGLDALQMLNRRDGITVTEMAQRIRLPRTTAYRILETLRAGGWALRDGADDRYRPSMLVRSLSEGIHDEGWVATVAKPELEALGHDILWPMGLYVLAEGKLILRVATDWSSPVALVRYAPGERAGLEAMPVGAAMLFSRAAAERDALVAALVPTTSQRSAVLREVEIARRRGFALREDPVEGESAIAIPISDPGSETIHGVLQMRWIKTAVTPERVIDQFLPRLAKVADRIGSAAAQASARSEAIRTVA